MNKHTLWLFVVILVVYFAVVFGDESASAPNAADSSALQSGPRTELEDEARTRRRHRLWHMWGWHALAIAYWVKVKLIIVAFFVGSAVFVALRYVWPHKCAITESVHEGPIFLDHHPSSHHDHIPYSLDHSSHYDHSPSFDHSFDSSGSSFDPYSAYSGAYTEDITSTGEAVSPTAPATHRLGRRSVRQAPQRMKTEEQIAEFLFSFLGLDSKACRRRFVCEMEFRSRLNPLSSMAFRIVGRGFFEKYTNANNKEGHANSFAECAAVNPECVFIEQNVEDEADNDEETSIHTESDVDESTSQKVENEIDEPALENNVIADSNVNLEVQNDENLKLESRFPHLRQRGDRQLNLVAERILAQKH